MIFQNEKQILKIIRYVPSLFLVSISLIILSFLYYENIKTFRYQKDEIQKNHIIKSKEKIKDRVDNTYRYLYNLQDSTERALKKSLKDEMQKAYAVANAIYESNKNRPAEEIKKLIKDALRPIRFNNGRGYFFIHDKSQFANTMHPIMPHLQGKNSYNVKDARGTYIIRQMHELLKKTDETSYEWYWYRPSDKKTQYKKIGYIKNFKPFNWFIGTGEYVVDFEKQQKQMAIEHIKSIRYSEIGYIFVIDYDGKILSHLRESNINKKVLDTKGFEHVKDIIQIARNGSGFISYTQNKKPTTNEPAPKTSYIKGINEWGWALGTGFYENDVQEIIQNKKRELDNTLLAHMKNTLVISVVLTIILLLVSRSLENMIRKKFKAYKNEISLHLKDKIEQQNILAQQAKMAAMGEMIGNIAHQWRQPLSSITSSASSILLQSELDILDKKSLVDGLNTINSRSIYLSNTIDDFRNFFNTDKEKTKFALVPTIDDTISLISAKLNNKNIQIIKNVEDLEIVNLKNEFIQVIINILNNAKDALENTKGDKFIFIDVYKQNSNVIVKIRDNAGGIKKEIKDKIFEPYFTTKHQSQGTGIGLYMSEQIVTKSMNGTIKASNVQYTYLNKQYKGALFKMTFSLKK